MAKGLCKTLQKNVTLNNEFPKAKKAQGNFVKINDVL